MIKSLPFLLFLPAALMSASGALALDVDWNGLEDSYVTPAGPAPREDASVAIVDTGDGSIDDYATRLAAIGYAYTLIPMNAGYGTLIGFQVVILPVSHGSSCCLANFQALAGDYVQYVANGGCLYVGQPNPYDVGPLVVTWVPYYLYLTAFYDGNDCPPIIADPNHCITEGLQGSDLPGPFDTVEALGPEWIVLTTGPVTGKPGLLTASYGSGNVLVDFGHPSAGALCVYSNAGFARMVGCCLGAPVPVVPSTWGSIKALYRE